MSVLRYPWRPDTSQLRFFGALLATLSLALGVWSRLVHSGFWWQGFWCLGFAAGVVGLFRPGLLRGIYLLWMAMVFPIAWIISHLLLACLYFGLFFPVALFQRVLGRDALHLRRPAATDRESLWRRRRQSETVDDYRRLS